MNFVSVSKIQHCSVATVTHLNRLFSIVLSAHTSDFVQSYRTTWICGILLPFTTYILPILRQPVPPSSAILCGIPCRAYIKSIMIRLLLWRVESPSRQFVTKRTTRPLCSSHAKSLITTAFGLPELKQGERDRELLKVQVASIRHGYQPAWIVRNCTILIEAQACPRWRD